MEDNNRKLSSDESSLMSINELLKNNDQYLLNIIHDLRSHLNVITSAAQFMEHNYKDDKSLKYIEIIKRNSFKMLKLINNLIDSNKIKNNYYKLNKKNIDIVPMIENTISCIEKFASERNINLIFDTNEEECIMAIDPEAIDRVIMNLLSNAIKFSNENSNIYINLVVKDKEIELSFKDEGCGISKEEKERIFDRFYKGKNNDNIEGSGIGLNLCMLFVKAHDGKIFLESEINKGSIFTVILPRKIEDHIETVKEEGNLINKNQEVEIEFSDTYKF
ncbi:sensor histidine kinase KdpD [Clostridium sp. CAG:265]|uniref:sensor histidine kinase n=1 Tax=Clostridium sp. CAG:265 TaxID=1262787 RepID=UPI00033E39F5|nr:HAMP domain-containing sensor histidine kinase [Clostridium sp. CAG:265]CDB73893.1 histidine kinase [Clostridium sp. CAG:265]